MTRIARYQLYACPACSVVYKHPLWGSVSVHIPRSINPGLERVCTKCGFRAALANWTALGTVERSTSEMQARRTAALMYSLSLGPKPTEEKKKIFQRIKEFWLGSKPADPSEQYAEIKIADTVD